MTEKIYCYVDETGQDTMGKLFIVVAIVIEKEREVLIKGLENIETQSGKHKLKWVKSKKTIREKYLIMALSLKELKNRIFYQIFKKSKAYQDLVNIVIVKSINRYIKQQNIAQYEVTVLIDGLRKTQVRKVGKELRDLGLKIRKVKGARDESDPIIRLADMVAGMIRRAEQGNQKFRIIMRDVDKKNIVKELK